MSEEVIFGTPMKVREAIALLAYGAEYEIKGAYSGKIYHRSWKNKKDHVEQFYDETVVDNPFYTKMRINSTSGIGEWACPIIGIWMHDRQMYMENEDGNN
jgi:hypothetical protein